MYFNANQILAQFAQWQAMMVCSTKKTPAKPQEETKASEDDDDEEGDTPFFPRAGRYPRKVRQSVNKTY